MLAFYLFPLIKNETLQKSSESKKRHFLNINVRERRNGIKVFFCSLVLKLSPLFQSAFMRKRCKRGKALNVKAGYLRLRKQKWNNNMQLEERANTSIYLLIIEIDIKQRFIYRF